MKREDYVFVMGYDGNTVIVDKRARTLYGKLDAASLADRGLFRAAYRRAVYDKDEKAARYTLEKYNAVSPISYKHSTDLSVVFGVQPPSEDAVKVRAV